MAKNSKPKASADKPAGQYPARAGSGREATADADQTTNGDSTPKDDTPSSSEIAQTIGKFVAILLVLLAIVLIQRYCSRKHEPTAGSTISSLDGDTMQTGELMIRLFGIDAPELHQTCKDAKGNSYACGRSAKAKLTTLLKAGDVKCTKKETVPSGNVIATCSAQGVPDIGEAMVRSGYAVSVPSGDADPYKDAQEEAKQAKKGIWRGSFDPPSQWKAAHPGGG